MKYIKPTIFQDNQAMQTDLKLQLINIAIIKPCRMETDGSNMGEDVVYTNMTEDTVYNTIS